MRDDMQALATRLTTLERQVAIWRALGMGALLLALVGTASAFAGRDTTLTADRLILRGTGNRTVSLTVSPRGGVQLDFAGGSRGPNGSTAEITILDDGNEVARLGGAMARNAHP
ncbi:MAG: hypothetical protein JWN79_2307 [Gemmatimonadetes bacterium]|jgi:hypothetical protein|nr:hypothetical protein [Gemmatimonadota bacterium]